MAMMVIRGQMVRIQEVKEVVKEERTIKSVTFTVADRDKMKRIDSNGKETWVTKGFYFCKAYGRAAENIHKHFSAKDESGKLISRRIYLEVDPQHYTNTKEVEVSMPVSVDNLCKALGVDVPEGMSGKKATLKKKHIVEYDDTIHIVTRWAFEDNKQPEECELEIDGEEEELDIVIE